MYEGYCIWMVNYLCREQLMPAVDIVSQIYIHYPALEACVCARVQQSKVDIVSQIYIHYPGSMCMCTCTTK